MAHVRLKPRKSSKPALPSFRAQASALAKDHLKLAIDWIGWKELKWARVNVEHALRLINVAEAEPNK